ncbi:MAG TPA: hypothetical protein EYH30_03355 [Anaerolineales bacterium]|nr:hypothetical protein [Anaerolineales bacterium]
MAKARRAARMARIIERLQRLDDGTLEVLDRLTAEAIGGVGPRREQGVGRRRFLGAVAGGAVVAVTGGLALWQLGAAHTAALEDEATALRQIVALYDEMDRTGLDDQVEQGLAAVGGLLEGVRGPAEGLLSAVETARAALLDFQSRFPSLQTGFQWLQESLSTLSQRLLGLENEVNQALGLSGPIGETMGGFLAEVLDRLPYTTAQRVRGGLERVGEVVTAVPTLVQGLYSRILEPMEGWFSHRATAGLNGWIVNPLLTTVLDPAQVLAERVLGLIEACEEQLAGPAREGLARRRQIRQEIARLRQERGL